jgi:hypothetical protein
MIRVLLIAGMLLLGARDTLADGALPQASPAPAPAAPTTPRRSGVRRQQALLNVAGVTTGVFVATTAMAYVGREKDYGRVAANLATGFGGALSCSGGGLLIARAAGVSDRSTLKTIGWVGSLVGATGGTVLGYLLTRPTGLRRPAVAGGGAAAGIAGTIMLVLPLWGDPI